MTPWTTGGAASAAAGAVTHCMCLARAACGRSGATSMSEARTSSLSLKRGNVDDALAIVP